MLLFGLHLREEDHIADGFLAGQQHREPIDADAETCSGGHTVFQCAEEIFIKRLYLFDSAGAVSHLFFEPGSLIERIVQLAERIAELLSVADRFEPLN